MNGPQTRGNADDSERGGYRRATPVFAWPRMAPVLAHHAVRAAQVRPLNGVRYPWPTRLLVTVSPGHPVAPSDLRSLLAAEARVHMNPAGRRLQLHVAQPHVSNGK